MIQNISVTFSEEVLLDRMALNLLNESTGVSIDLSLTDTSIFRYDAESTTASWDLANIFWFFSVVHVCAFRPHLWMEGRTKETFQERTQLSLTIPYFFAAIRVFYLCKI